jgi:BirA family biotin operon repressor/biotin-[acetyl-CoA-carboxylase] ligase
MTLVIPLSEAVPDEFAEAFSNARARLEEFGRRVLYFASIGSTNDVAAAIAAKGEGHGVLVVAGSQTAGRGRRGRTWFSPSGSGLYVSAIVDPARGRQGSVAVDATRSACLLTLTAGVAIAEAVEAITGLRPDIKWPNDILIARRKVAGILAEGVTSGSGLSSIVLGYGINVGATSYPPELAGVASSLETELGRPVDRAQLCVETVAAIARRTHDLADGRFDAILDAWCARAPGCRGASVSWQTPSGPQTGITEGIDEQGALLVRVSNRTKRILAGEVVWAP